MLDTQSPELFRLCEASRSPNLPLMGETLATEGNVTFMAITLIYCDIQRNFTSSFKNLQLIHVFSVQRGYTRPKRGYSLDTLFAKNDFDP